MFRKSFNKSENSKFGKMNGWIMLSLKKRDLKITVNSVTVKYLIKWKYICGIPK